MIWLLAASIIWGLSFGLIKGMTAGLDPLVLGFLRSVVAGIVFLPFAGTWRYKASIPAVWRRRSVLIAFWAGVVQLGLMYPPYLSSFQYLKAHEVALYTMTTPLLVGAMTVGRSESSRVKLLLACVLAVIGGAVCAWKSADLSASLKGILLVQLANAMFAAGSLIWQKLCDKDQTIKERAALMVPYFAGASAASGLAALFLSGTHQPPTHQQWLVILWLGAVASGAGFYLWNTGVERVSTAKLAVANNLKLPMAVLISLTVFSESANLVTLIPGLMIIMLALLVADGRLQAKSRH
jgi:drug/metabolite transporter (DMT)-like permease